MTQKEEILNKLKYLGLNKKKLPNIIREFKPLDFTIPKNYQDNNYKQYRYVNINEIQILLTPTNRLDDIRQKYKNAAPLLCYLDTKNPANSQKCSIFFNIVKNADIEKVKDLEEEMDNLNKRLTFKLTYKHDYLWQIYYSPKANRYFMLYPTNDNEPQALLYLIKKQMEESDSKIFVPIINLDYSNNFLDNSQINDISNYLNLLTKDYPNIYEIQDKSGHSHLQIYGKTRLLDNIDSKYRVIFSSKEQAVKYYKILKAMFILQSKYPNYFTFDTNISKKGELEFSFNQYIINDENIAKFINSEYKLGVYRLREIVQNITNFEKKLYENKDEIDLLEQEFLAKEKQIAKFLECKKSFLGKVKFYFTYSKSKDSKVNKTKNNNQKQLSVIKIDEKEKVNYTIDDLLDLYKQVEKNENHLKTILLDLNALKLKHKNMKAKIENASKFIDEIDKHRKSIFEFWKYSNKDEVDKLGTAEIETTQNLKPLSQTFVLEEDLEKFGSATDKYQRAVLSDEYLNSIYVATTPLLECINKLKTKELTNDELENVLDDLKQQLIDKKSLSNEDYDIFGGYENDPTKVEMLGSKQVRENKRDLFAILGINANMKKSELLEKLDIVINNIEYAKQKVCLIQDIPIYKAFSHGNLNPDYINIFGIDPKLELQMAMDKDSLKMILYKFNLKTKTNAIALTNSVYYNNDNKTLPLGMDLSSNVIFDISKYNLNLKSKTIIRKVVMEDETEDFSKISIKSITVKEYDIESIKEEKDSISEKLSKAQQNLQKYKDNMQEIKEEIKEEVKEEIKEDKLEIEDTKNDQVESQELEFNLSIGGFNFEEPSNSSVKTNETIAVPSNDFKDTIEKIKVDEEILEFSNFMQDENTSKKSTEEKIKEEVSNINAKEEVEEVKEVKEVNESNEDFSEFEELLSFDFGFDDVQEEDIKDEVKEEKEKEKEKKPKKQAKTKTKKEDKEVKKVEVKETEEEKPKRTRKTKKAKEEEKEKEENPLNNRISNEILELPVEKPKRGRKKKTQEDEEEEKQEPKTTTKAKQKIDVPVRENLPKSSKRSRKKVSVSVEE